MGSSNRSIALGAGVLVTGLGTWLLIASAANQPASEPSHRQRPAPVVDGAPPVAAVTGERPLGWWRSLPPTSVPDALRRLCSDELEGDERAAAWIRDQREDVLEHLHTAFDVDRFDLTDAPRWWCAIGVLCSTHGGAPLLVDWYRAFARPELRAPARGMRRRIVSCFPARSDSLLEAVGRNLPHEEGTEVAGALDWMRRHYRNDPRVISYVERYLEARREDAHPNVELILEELRR